MQDRLFASDKMQVWGTRKLCACGVTGGAAIFVRLLQGRDAVCMLIVMSAGRQVADSQGMEWPVRWSLAISPCPRVLAVNRLQPQPYDTPVLRMK